MNIFDKICAVLALLLGIVLGLLGVVGLFVGCNAHFSLPPILGVLPVFFGWGIVRSVGFAFKYRKPSEQAASVYVPPAQTAPQPQETPDGFNRLS